MSKNAIDSERVGRKNESLRQRAAATEWRVMIDEALICIATVGLDKRFLTCNQAFCAFLGYSEEELRQKTIVEVTLPEDAEIGMAGMRAIAAGENKSSTVEQRFVRKDGGVVWGEVSINIARSSQGLPPHVPVFISDITERKRAEEKLRKGSANLDAIFECSPIGMMVLDETTNIVLANSAFVVLCGGSKSDVLQHRPGNALRCVHSSKDPRGCGYTPACPTCHARNGIEGLIASGGTMHDAELALALIRSGSLQKVWVSIGAEPVLIDGHRHLCVAMQDITGRKAAEQQLMEQRNELQALHRLSEIAGAALRESEENLRRLNVSLEQRVSDRTVELEASTKELEAFSYSVSHDLRAPLRAVDGFSLALLEDCEDRLDAESKDHLARIRAATQRMGALIDDMLRLSRITRAQMLVERVNLTEIAWSIIHELQKSQPGRAVTVKIADDLEDEADPKLMRIALENLLSNAWKFTGRQPEAVVEFGSTNEGGKKAYFIRDNGAGFDMAHANKLFTPFQRLHSVEEYPGTGIGLGTVQRIMNRHGGTVWAEGQVDKGATFYFSFQK